ncbi:MAG: hypothetical protein Q7T16_01080 [Candidatus Burarchaeum sp.]|nr:hypothetical protein [Candidatus Burarchaeum sp.]MDO8339229.1 hypothetical protein [Candidatus Burarchaeum sp.]
MAEKIQAAEELAADYFLAYVRSLPKDHPDLQTKYVLAVNKLRLAYGSEQWIADVAKEGGNRLQALELLVKISKETKRYPLSFRDADKYAHSLITDGSLTPDYRLSVLKLHHQLLADYGHEKLRTGYAAVALAKHMETMGDWASAAETWKLAAEHFASEKTKLNLLEALEGQLNALQSGLAAVDKALEKSEQAAKPASPSGPSIIFSPAEDTLNKLKTDLLIKKVLVAAAQFSPADVMNNYHYALDHMLKVHDLGQAAKLSHALGNPNLLTSSFSPEDLANLSSDAIYYLTMARDLAIASRDYGIASSASKLLEQHDALTRVNGLRKEHRGTRLS